MFAPLTASLSAAQAATGAEGSTPEPARRRGLSVLEEVVVTAQRREENINDVSIAISAFSGEDLKALGVTDTRDLGLVVPGLSVSNAGFNKPVYTLRGIGFNETSQTASSTVGVYIDEQNFPFDVMTKGANLDVERVEVLKGPQGTLYGRNTTGGAINYISNKPTDSFEAAVSGSYGRFQTTDVEGMISGPLSDTVRARLALRDIRSSEGWQVSQTRGGNGQFGRLGEVDKQSGRLIVDWDVNDKLPVRFMLQGWRDFSEPQAPQAIAIVAQNPIAGDIALHPDVANHPTVPVNTDDNRVADWPTDYPWQIRDTFYMGSVRADWEINDELTLTAQLVGQDYLSDDSLLPQNGLSVVNVENRLYAHTTAYNAELRLAGVFGETGNWQLGGFYSYDHVREDLEFFTDTNSAVFPTPGAQLAFLTQLGGLADMLGLGDMLDALPLSPGAPLLSDRITVLADQVSEVGAIFGHIEQPLGEQFQLTAGLRYTEETRDYSGCSADSPERSKGVGFAPLINLIALARPALNPGSPIPTEFADGGCFSIDPATNNPGKYYGSLTEDNVSGRLALDWTPNDDVLLYLSYSRGFKSGSFPAVSASDNAQLEPVTQEQLDALETGGKLSLLNSALQFNYALFFYEYKDKQLLSRIVDPIFGPLPVLRNAPESEVHGAEMELQYSPIDGLFLSASAAYIKTEVLEFVGVNEAGEEQSFAGNEFNFSPRLSYTLLANYLYDLSAELDLTLGIDYSYKDSTNSVLGGDALFDHDAYGVTNARVGVGDKAGVWTVTVWGRNVLDEFYTVSIFDPGDAVSRYVGMPRTYGVTVDYNFF